jgi:hypothetical protein
MWDWEIQEPKEQEEWHSKISHEDQKEFSFPEAAPEPQPVLFPEPAAEQSIPPFGAGLHGGQETSAPVFPEDWLTKLRRFLSVPTNFYATVAVGLGVLCGIAIATFSWHASNPNGPYDLGSVTSAAVGLRGHLFTKWEGKLQYRLTFEPVRPELLSGFSAAVLNSQRPLSIGIALTDAQGFALCSKQILVRYDTRNATAKDPDTEGLALDPQVRNSEAELADAQESVREQGQDAFQNQIGSDGKVASISAQGELPCSASAYENAVSWNFSPDFPSVAEQNELLHQLAEKSMRNAANSPAAIEERRRAAARLAANPPPKFYIEGEDAIVDYDAGAGIISTRGGKTFTIDKGGAEAASLKGHDFPLHVHYRCDQFGSCTLFTAGVGTQHTRLRK